MKIFKTKPKKEFYNIERDGITQSLIAMWLTCREKAKLYLQGWDSKYHSPALTYGSIGHGMLELAYLDIQSGKLKSPPTFKEARKYGDLVEAKWRKENLKPNKEALEYLDSSLALLEQTLPIYFDFWRKDFKTMKWISLEKKFNVPLNIGEFSNGEVIIPIRGKRDGEFLMGNKPWLFETKFKSMISEGDIVETLSFETQVMLYMWAMWAESNYKVVPRGVLYNIVRKTSLKQHKDESLIKFAARIADDMKKRPDFYFIRMESVTTLQEIQDFNQNLINIVKEINSWWKGNGTVKHYKNTYSCIGKYGKCSMLPVCSRQDWSGLVKRESMFKELEDY